MRDITTKEFLDAIFENVPDDEIVCVTRDFVAFDWEAPEFVDRNPRSGASWHFCISTLKAEARGPDKLSRGAKDVAATYVIVLDDVGTKAAEPPVAPSYRLETSPDNFHWGYLIDPCEDAARVDAVMRALGALGFSDPAARGANRLMRFPGSKKNGFEAVLHEWEPHRYWSLDELMTAFGIDEADLEVKPVVAAPVAGGVMVTEDAGEAFLRSRGDVLGELNDRGFLPVRCPWASEHTDTTAVEAGYSPLGVGDRPETRSFHCFHQHGHGTREFLDWIADRGGPRLSVTDRRVLLPRFQARYAVLSEGPVVIDLWNRGYDCAIFKKEEFRTVDGALERRIPPEGGGTGPMLITEFFRSDDTQRYRAMRFRPDLPDQLTFEDGVGRTFLNHYARPRHTETEEAPEMSLRLVRALFGEHAELILNSLAYKIQHPGSRGFSTVGVTQGAQGLGRSTFGALLRAVVDGFVATIDIDELTGQKSQFNSWAVGSQFVVIDESKNIGDDRNPYKVSEHLKPLTDMRTDPIEINDKYGRKRQERIFFNLFIFSNHADALPLPPDDRRFFVFESFPHDLDEAFFGALNGDMTAEGGRFYWWLMRRDVDDFNPREFPVTDAKRRMIDTSQSDRDDIERRILHGDGPEVFTKSTLQDAVNQISDELGVFFDSDAESRIVRHIWKRLIRLDDGINGRRVVVWGKRAEVRARINPEKWRRVNVAKIEKGLEW